MVESQCVIRKFCFLPVACFLLVTCFGFPPVFKCARVFGCAWVGARGRSGGCAPARSRVVLCVWESVYRVALVERVGGGTGELHR